MPPSSHLHECPGCSAPYQDEETAVCPQCQAPRLRIARRVDPRRPTPVLPPGTWVGGSCEIVCRLPLTGADRTYVARDHGAQGRTVLLQVLSEARSRHGIPRDQLLLGFSQAQGLRHPGLIQPLRLDFADLPALLSEYFEGVSLARILGGPVSLDQARAGMPPARAIALLTQVAAILDDLHDRGLSHGDLRTEAILIGRERGQEVVRILDLALAGAGLVGNPDFGSMTLVHPCRAPEWFRDEEPRQAADIYALSAIAYWMLAGRPPFAGARLEMAILREMPPPIPRIPTAANQVLLRGLDRDPRQRHRSGDALVQDLARALQGFMPEGELLASRGARTPSEWQDALTQTFWTLVLFVILVFGMVYLLVFHTHTVTGTDPDPTGVRSSYEMRL